MRTLIAGVALTGLVTVAACTYTVEMPSDSRSPSVTTTQTDPAAGATAHGSMPPGHGMQGMPPGHGMQGMPPMGSPHGDMGGMMGGMSPHGGMPRTPPSRTIPIGSDLALHAPEAWKPKQTASMMLQNEFSVPAVEGDSNDGRATVMSAGGSVEANIDRWIGQFSQPDGSPTAEKAKTEKLEVAGRDVHLVDISGTFADSKGMMGPVVQRPDYRMLAAIIVAPEATYFVKFYGPQKTVGSQAEAFRKMIQGLGKPKADAKEPPSEEAGSEESSSEEAASKQGASTKAESGEAASKEAASEEPASEEAASGEAATEKPDGEEPAEE